MHPSNTPGSYYFCFLRCWRNRNFPVLYCFSLGSCKGKQYNKLCTVLLFLAFNPGSFFWSVPGQLPARFPRRHWRSIVCPLWGGRFRGVANLAKLLARLLLTGRTLK
jgi:hypothetical protein